LSSELKDLKSDVAELNQFLKSAERQYVKEIMLTEVDTVSAKVNDILWNDISKIQP
jgi:hypothetical protein